MSLLEKTPQSVFTRDLILDQDYYLTQAAEAIERRLEEVFKKTVVLHTNLRRYMILRLFMARSISDTKKFDYKKEKSSSRPIKGNLLFGVDDFAVWASIIITEGGLGHQAAFSDFKSRVEYHLERGAKLVSTDLENNPDFMTHIKAYSSILNIKPDSNGFKHSAEEINLKFGNVSLLYPSKKPVSFVLNKVGSAPHIALMGASGGGKSTTGMQIAKQILDQSNVPFLLIDPKGDFVHNGKPAGAVKSWASSGVNAIEAGETPIPLNFLPDPGVGESTIHNTAMRLRDTFAACCKSVGEVQKDRIFNVIEKVVLEHEDKSLDNIKDLYYNELQSDKSDKDSLFSVLKSITALKIFEPKLSSDDFFSKSWIISLKSIASEELKKLVTMLLLDATKTHILRQPDSVQVGNLQTLRNLVIIDEARRVMSSNKSESLSEMIRLGRSKGLVVMLLSQDPTDFQGESDDFLTQIGTCIAFKCKSASSGLSRLGTVYGRKLLPEQFSSLEDGVAFCIWPNGSASKVKCWGNS